MTEENKDCCMSRMKNRIMAVSVNTRHLWKR